MVALPFWSLLTFVRPIPVPPTPHQVHLSHSFLICSNQPANGVAPVLSLPFWQALTTVHPTPVPPTPHPVHLSHPLHPSIRHIRPILAKTMCPHPAIMIQSSQYGQSNPANPDDTIQIQRYPAIQQYDTIQPVNTANTIQPANTQSRQPIQSYFFYLYYISSR